MSSAESRLSESERLAALDKELVALHELCQRSELAPEEVRRALQPLVSAVNWSAGVNRARWVVPLVYCCFSQLMLQSALLTYLLVTVIFNFLI